LTKHKKFYKNLDMIFGLQNIAPGEIGTDQTVAVISQFVKNSLRQSKIRLFTLSVLDRRGYLGRNASQAAQIIQDWVRENIAYIPDPIDVETVQTPGITLRVKAGDCDDHVVLVSAMLQSVGIPVRYVVIGKDRDSFSHIYTEALIGSRWVAVDTTLAGNIGTSANMPVKKCYLQKPGAGLSSALSSLTDNLYVKWGLIGLSLYKVVKLLK